MLLGNGEERGHVGIRGWDGAGGCFGEQAGWGPERGC